MISVKQVLAINDLAIERYGGALGVRDMGSLESALARPFQTFGGNDLYGDIFSKAAAPVESIAINHPFVDGNKRTAYLLMEAMLRSENIRTTASDDDLYNFVVSISTGETQFDGIVEWLKQHTKAL